MNKCYVYTYSYPNGTPFYIGKGTGHRYRVHLCDAKANRNLDKWAVRVIRKLLRNGEQPIITKVVENLTSEEACQLEIELITKYGRKDIGTGVLTNCTSGGDKGAQNLAPEVIAKRSKRFIDWSRTRRVVTPEYAKRISEGLKLWHADNPMSSEQRFKFKEMNTGEGNPFYGKTHTTENKEKARNRMLGTVVSEEKRQKHIASMAGKHKGEENPFSGKTHTEETKITLKEKAQARLAKIKEQGIPHWNAGKTPTAETRAKLTIERTCPHCGVTGKGSAMNRYHMNKCKLKPLTLLRN